ncbi:MAG: hypothetical protein ACAI35_28305 [Candidatus Methylacidiphilales bacterium]|nr:hypothetical protein [Candidatus Methylacidiphilales bacterium]
MSERTPYERGRAGRTSAARYNIVVSVAIAVLVLVVYPLSIGPVASRIYVMRIPVSGRASIYLHPKVYKPVSPGSSGMLEQFYSPLMWLCYHNRGAMSVMLPYLDYWGRSLDIETISPFVETGQLPAGSYDEGNGEAPSSPAYDPASGSSPGLTPSSAPQSHSAAPSSESGSAP